MDLKYIGNQCFKIIKIEAKIFEKANAGAVKVKASAE